MFLQRLGYSCLAVQTQRYSTISVHNCSQRQAQQPLDSMNPLHFLIALLLLLPISPTAASSGPKLQFPLQFSALLRVTAHAVPEAQQYPPRYRRMRLSYDYVQKLAKAEVEAGYEAAKLQLRRYDQVKRITATEKAGVTHDVLPLLWLWLWTAERVRRAARPDQRLHAVVPGRDDALSGAAHGERTVPGS